MSFVHVTDPYEDEASTSTAQPHLQAQQQQSHIQAAIPSSSSQYQHPQYVDVAATSLKAMIDPNLEAGTGGGAHGDDGTGNSVGQDGMNTSTGGAVELTEAETLNETILNALKQSDVSMG